MSNCIPELNFINWIKGRVEHVCKLMLEQGAFLLVVVIDMFMFDSLCISFEKYWYLVGEILN